MEITSEIFCFLISPQLDIVQQEYIHEAGLEQFDVVKTAFNGSGTWLATVEERKQRGAELELNLKLWVFDDETQRYRPVLAKKRVVYFLNIMEII